MTISDKSVLVQRYINSAYDKVLAVYNNLASIILVADNIGALSGTAADAIATAADVVSTNADVVTTNADVVLTDADVVAAAASAAAALVSENAAATSYDDFDDRYLGVKVAAPTVDNDGNALVSGAMYFLLTTDTMYVRNSFSAWQAFFSNAAAVSNVAAGDIIATDVQAAINELDTEKAKLAGDIAQAFSASTIAANGDITTDTDGTDSIGATAKRWLKGWFDSLTVTGDVGAATVSATTGMSVGGATAGAGGVVFPATAVAVADVNTLDDYEEGTFNVTLAPSGTGTITINTSFDALSYTKIGSRVHISGTINVTSVSSPTGTGVRILGLPFTPTALTDAADIVASTANAQGLSSASFGWILSRTTGITPTTYIELLETDGSSTASGLPGKTQAGTSFSVDLTYVST